MADRLKVKWLEEPAEKDYAAASNFLSLFVPPVELGPLIAALKSAPSGRWRAKDILRATQLPLLSVKESREVAEKLEKVRQKEALAPILLVVLRPDVVAQIADGYHRTCAAFLADEDAFVPGRILFVHTPEALRA